MKSNLAMAGLVAVFTFSGAAWADGGPSGLWKTIDDDTKQERSLVRITESSGVFTGKIEKLLEQAKANAVCEKCTDERKGQPVAGLQIIKGVKASTSDKELWDGGEILDPNNGKTYKVRLKPIDGGKKLEVRGYIGAPMFGRTQTWIRVE
ncbi:DUF2147 domain-containing protein [Ideonella sp.]|uniref:DUF2147 domain-containing protein n=1 Tax=Ideonella sp. TaxID=1929293 RepID=UPI003BB767A6